MQKKTRNEAKKALKVSNKREKVEITHTYCSISSESLFTNTTDHVSLVSRFDEKKGKKEVGEKINK